MSIMNRGKIVTVVGGTGFLGGYVVRLLADHGYQIRVLARDADVDLRVKTAGDVGQIKLISADISKPESLQGKLANSYAVINLAGILYQTGRQKFDSVQGKGPGTLARFAKQAGAKHFIHVSAIGADSTSPSKYARSKAAGEQEVRAAFPESVIVRPSIIFGVEDNFFNKFATMASLSPFLPLIGGKTKFQPVYVLDVAQAIVTTLENESTAGKTYELGGPAIYSFRKLLEFICRTTERKPFLINIPFPVASLIGFFAGFLPNPPLTRDQVTLLKFNNVVTNDNNTLNSLGIIPQSVENIVPLYLERFRRKLAVQEKLC